MKEHLKNVLIGLSAFPLTVIFYLVYVHLVSFLDPVLTVIFGGGFLLVILATVYWLITNLKDFVVSIFKENKEVDKKGFKKHF